MLGWIELKLERDQGLASCSCLLMVADFLQVPELRRNSLVRVISVLKEVHAVLHRDDLFI